MTQKYIVLKASRGGLGDLIKSLLSACLYAEISNRALIIDWKDTLYSDSNDNVFFKFLKIKNLECLDINDCDLKRSVFPEAWRGRLHLSLHQIYETDNWSHWDREAVIKRYSFDYSTLDYKDEFLVTWDFDQVDHMLSHYKFESKLKLFQYAAQRYLDTTVDPVLIKVIADAEQENYDLGIHIRSTKEFDSAKGATAVNQFMEFVASNNFEQSKLFLATDNQNVESAFIEKYVNLAVKEKWFPEAGDAIHLSASVPDKAKTLQSAFVDILTLANCQQLLLTPYSSFSEVAAIFAKPTASIHYPNNQRGLIKRLSSLFRSK